MRQMLVSFSLVLINGFAFTVYGNVYSCLREFQQAIDNAPRERALPAIAKFLQDNEALIKQAQLQQGTLAQSSASLFEEEELAFAANYQRPEETDRQWLDRHLAWRNLSSVPSGIPFVGLQKRKSLNQFLKSDSREPMSTTLRSRIDRYLQENPAADWENATESYVLKRNIRDMYPLLADPLAIALRVETIDELVHHRLAGSLSVLPGFPALSIESPSFERQLDEAMRLVSEMRAK